MFDVCDIIEALNSMDTGDHSLDEFQFKQLLKKYQISTNKVFIDLAFNGLVDQRTYKVPYQHIVVLYMSSFKSLFNQTMATIFFRAVDSGQRCSIGFSQFYMIVKALVEKPIKSDWFNLFNKFDKSNKGLISFRDVAKILFKTNVSRFENPHKSKLFFRSQCACLLNAQ